MADINPVQLALFQAHMERAIDFVRQPMRPDVKVTIIVRAPESLPADAMISTNDKLDNAFDALFHFCMVQPHA
jgi:hypothetical protein